jgi:hypothetical protein
VFESTSAIFKPLNYFTFTTADAIFCDRPTRYSDWQTLSRSLRGTRTATYTQTLFVLSRGIAGTSLVLLHFACFNSDFGAFFVVYDGGIVHDVLCILQAHPSVFVIMMSLNIPFRAFRVLKRVCLRHPALCRFQRPI